MALSPRPPPAGCVDGRAEPPAPPARTVAATAGTATARAIAATAGTANACAITATSRTACAAAVGSACRLRRRTRSTARRSTRPTARIARTVRRRRLADRAADLPGLLVRLPLRAATALSTPAIGRVATGVHRVASATDVGGVVDVDVGFAATVAVAIATPRRADCGAPDDPGRQGGPRRVRVVISRIRGRVVAVHRRRAVDHNRGWVVLRHVDHLRIGRLDDDDLLLGLHHLLVVGLKVARCFRLAAKDLDRLDHGALVGDDGFAECAGPVEIVAHLLHDIGVVEQRLHRVVPLVVDRQLRVGLALVQIPISLHDLQRAGRSRQYDRDQVIRVQRDRPDELREFLSRKRRGCAARCRRRLRERRRGKNDRHRDGHEGGPGGLHATFDERGSTWFHSALHCLHSWRHPDSTLT